MGSVSPTPATSMPDASQRSGASRRPTRSRGIEVPDLVGRPAASSVAELRKLGLKPNSVPEPVTDAAQAGLVIAQDPPAGEFMPAGSRVRIEIGDHSLFDPRKYSAPERAPEVRELIPPIPTPLELLSYGNPRPLVSDHEIQQTDGNEATAPHIGEEGSWSRWPELGSDYHDGEPFEDPFAGDEYPDPEYHVGEVTGSVPADTRPGAGVASYQPRWTSRQRKRVLLSVGLLLVLVCLTVATRLNADATGQRRNGASGSSVMRTRVVTVTVTAQPSSTKRSVTP